MFVSQKIFLFFSELPKSECDRVGGRGKGKGFVTIRDLYWCKMRAVFKCRLLFGCSASIRPRLCSRTNKKNEANIHGMVQIWFWKFNYVVHRLDNPRKHISTFLSKSYWHHAISITFTMLFNYNLTLSTAIKCIKYTVLS